MINFKRYFKNNYDVLAKYFNNSTRKKILYVRGPIAVGKTEMIRHFIDKTPNEKIFHYKFSLPQKNDDNDGFPLFFEREYQKIRKSSWFWEILEKYHMEPEEITWNISIPIPLFSNLEYRFRMVKMYNQKECEQRIDRILSTFEKNEFKYIYLENIENASNELTNKIISTIISHAREGYGIKCIIEENRDTHEADNFHKLCHGQEHMDEVLARIDVTPLGDEDTKQYYKEYFKTDPPEDLIGKTRGLPVLIENYNNKDIFALKDGDAAMRLGNISESAEIILYCMAAAGKDIDSAVLGEISFLNDHYERSLLELYRKKFVDFIGNHVIFYHPLFLLYLLPRTSNIQIFGRMHIIKYLECKSNKTHYEYLELFRQYCLINKSGHAAKLASKYVFKCYLNQNFNYVMDCAGYFDHLVDGDRKRRIHILLIQTAIRKGNVREAIPYIKYIEGDDSKEAIMLYSQFLYLKNKFEDALKNLEKISPDIDDWHLTRCMGIKTACYISMGMTDKAREMFSLARNSIKREQDVELYWEFMRLMPEVARDEHTISEYTDQELIRQAARYSYVRTKALHNYAVHFLFAKKCEKGEEKKYSSILKRSALFFENGKYCEYSYSGICTAAYLIKIKRYEEARQVLESCRDYLHEQYDSFCWNLNYGVICFYEKNYNDCMRYFTNANDCLNGETSLDDPYFVYLLKYNNFCLSIAQEERMDKAAEILDELQIPQNCFMYQNKIERKKAIIAALRKGEKKIYELLCQESERMSLPMLEIGTLEFFDFNVNVLSMSFFQTL